MLTGGLVSSGGPTGTFRTAVSRLLVQVCGTAVEILLLT